MNGLIAANELHDAVPGVAVVMLTMMDNEQTRLMASYAGAVEFVGKHEPDDRLLVGDPTLRHRGVTRVRQSDG